MSNLYPVAGCKLFLGTAVALPSADLAESDFSGQSWTEVKGWQQMGRIGDTAEMISVTHIDHDRELKAKGTKNGGQMQNVFTQMATDPGQIALIAAAASKSNYAVKIELNDANGGAPSKRLFVCLVMGAEESGGGANTVRNLTTTFEINSNIVPVAAA